MIDEQEGLSFHHLGLALYEESRASLFLQFQGYRFGEQVYDPEQKVYLRLCTSGAAPAIELITPGPEDGPLTPVLKRYNELVYHLCYETADLDASLNALKRTGLRIIPVAEPRPAVLFGGRKVSFYTIRGFGLIELLEPAA